ncbi:MAG: helix-turn-helix domain-containing protein [Candidatus Aminicenantes bacterium]|nr:helix-turn-helix domain-containing protein [Candidatus Aminicenantes bacterium]
MARAKNKIDRTLLMTAKEEFKKIPGGKLAIQLKAIIISANHPVIQVAEIFGVSPRTIFRWIDKFKTKGSAGLKDQPKGHKQAKLTDKQKKEIEQWLASGKGADGKKMRWTLGKLKTELEKVSNINVSTTALWNHLKKTNLTIKK